MQRFNTTHYPYIPVWDVGYEPFIDDNGESGYRVTATSDFNIVVPPISALNHHRVKRSVARYA